MIKLIIEDDEGKTTVVPLILTKYHRRRKQHHPSDRAKRLAPSRAMVRNNGAVFIEDLESYNGIKVNGNRIGGRVAVAEGDRIQIRDYVLGLKSTVVLPEDAKTTR